MFRKTGLPPRVVRKKNTLRKAMSWKKEYILRGKKREYLEKKGKILKKRDSILREKKKPISWKRKESEKKKYIKKR